MLQLFQQFMALIQNGPVREYKNDPYIVPGFAAIIPSDCNAIEFYNPPTIGFPVAVANPVVVLVNERVIPPGAAWSIGGNFGEIDRTQYKISFSAPGGQCVVTRKYYQ